MKILELCLSPSFGGLEIYVCRAVAALSGDHETVAVTLPGSPIHDWLQAHGHEVRTLRTLSPRLPLRAAARLAAMFDERRIDLVHVNWGPDLALGALAKRLSRRRPRLVYTRHMLMNRSKRDVYHDFVYGQYDWIMAITRDMEQGLRQHLSSRHTHRIHQLYCGVPAPDTWLGDDERAALRDGWGFAQDAFVAGVFSRLEAAKGQHLLLEAMGLLRDRGITVHGLIVGNSMDAGYATRLRQMVDSLGLQRQVAFRDFVDQPQLWIQACDCLVLPTDRETFANIASEAMRAGVAVVSSDRGGMPEMIEHGSSGLLFASGNPAHLAEQLRLLFEDPARRAALAAAGRERADRLFSIERQFPKLVERFQELVDASAPAAV
jgi:L-malate glycosyltransferase